VTSDLTKIFKIINGTNNVNSSLFLEFDAGGRRGHAQKLFKRKSRLDVRKFLFANKVVNNWNYLSEACVKSVTLNGFKNICRYISLVVINQL